jgi:hypothetical protein
LHTHARDPGATSARRASRVAPVALATAAAEAE